MNYFAQTTISSMDGLTITCDRDEPVGAPSVYFYRCSLYIKYVFFTLCLIRSITHPIDLNLFLMILMFLLFLGNATSDTTSKHNVTILLV